MSLLLAPQVARPGEKAATRERGYWSPYDNNGGTCVAIAGDDYCVIAADTRMSTGYSILTRESSKLLKISDSCVVASAGFQGDAKTLARHLTARHQIYQHNHNKCMSAPALAQMLSNTLYYKRFFPYYTFNIVGGLDGNGKGCVYTYDAIGSYERVGYACQGTGQQLIMPVLDNQLKATSPLVLPATLGGTPLSESEALDLLKDCFASAAERDIYTGDSVEICIINAAGMRRESIPLRLD